MSRETSRLGQLIAKSSAWMLASQWVGRLLGLMTTAILARLLTPDDFGLFAISMTVFGLLTALGGFNFQLALVKNQNTTRAHYDTAWTLSLLRSFVVSAILVILAPSLAGFFEDARLEKVFVILGAMAFLGGFENVGVINFQKDFRFDKLFNINICGRIVYFFLTVIVAVIWRSYWALVVGFCAERICVISLGYIMQEYRPRLSLKMWREILGFSKWVMSIGLLQYLNNRSPILLIAKFAEIQSLGLYSVAYKLSSVPSSDFVQPAAKPLFPGLVKVVNDRARVKGIYLNALSVLLLIGVPVAAGIALLAEPLVRVVLGEDWLAAVPLVEVLALFALLRVFLGGTYEVLLALDKLHVMTLLSGIRLVILLPLLLWGVSSAGAYGAALALVGATAVRVLLNIVALSLLLNLTIQELAASCWRTAISTGAMTITLVLLQTLWTPGENVIEIAAQLLTLMGVGFVSFILSYAALRVFPGAQAEIDYKLVSLLKERIADFQRIEEN